jgi:hypothetical protein
VKSLLLRRLKSALGIADEPDFAAPTVAKQTTLQPPRPQKKADIAALLERARTASSRTTTVLEPVRTAELLERARLASEDLSAPPPPQHQNLPRRVELMMTGSVSRLALVRDALGDLQTELLQRASQGNLELRVTAFFDGCRHSTAWNRSPIDVGSDTTAWHCFQGRTRYTEALAYSANEEEPIDAIVMFGDRFDDNLAHALGIAERLRKRGTRIYAFDVGGRWRSRDAYAQLAECTDGAFVSLIDPRAFRRVMTIIADYVLRPVDALRVLPVPADPDAKALIERLKLLPPPLKLTRRNS